MSADSDTHLDSNAGGVPALAERDARSALCPKPSPPV